MRNPFRYFNSSPEMIRLTIMLWRAVDHEGEVLEVYATKSQDRKANLKSLKRATKRYGCPNEIVTDRPRSYRAALRDIGVESRQAVDAG